MSLLNDYSVTILAEQQQRELQDHAAEARLARLVRPARDAQRSRGDRRRWWLRVLPGLGERARITPAACPVPAPRRRPAH